MALLAVIPALITAIALLPALVAVLMPAAATLVQVVEVLILAAVTLLIRVWQLSSGAARAEGNQIRAPKSSSAPATAQALPTRDHDLGGPSLGFNSPLARAPDTSGGDVGQPLLVLD